MDHRGATTRPARLADAERIAEYHHACRLEALAPLFDEAIVAAMRPKFERWREWLQEGSGFTSVVVVDDDDVPFGHVTVHDNVLGHLFIDPPRQGEGFGRLLLGVGEQLLRDAGHAELQLQTRVGNVRAITLYESAGWIMTDELVIDEDDPGVRVEEHVLRKSVD